MKRFLSIWALFGSFTTIFCCFLPALFAALGFGAAFAGFIGVFPQVVWVSEHKGWVFGGAGFLVVIAGIAHYRSTNAACPTDPNLSIACSSTKAWSRRMVQLAIALYLIGFLSAFVLPSVLAD